MARSFSVRNNVFVKNVPFLWIFPNLLSSYCVYAQSDFLIARCDEILNDRSHQTYQTLKGTNIPPEALINWALSGIFVPFDFYSGQQ